LKIGTAACRIDASPDSIFVSPHAISVNGIAALITPSTRPWRRASQSARLP